MSEARDPREFLAHIVEFHGGYSHDAAEALVQQALDAERHDAAEEIRRADFGDPYYVGFGQAAAADLIDRSKGENRCRGCGEPSDDGRVHGSGGEFGGCV